MARLVLTLLIMGVILLPYLLLSTDSISNIYVLMLFKTLIPTFAAGFVLYCGLLEWLFLQLKVLDRAKCDRSILTINSDDE